MNDIHLSIPTKEDAEVLDKIRYNYWDADLEVPKGYQGPGHETLVAKKDGQIILGLTASLAVILDPLIRNPQASDLEVQKALIKAESALSFDAQKAGAIDAYIAIPLKLTPYMRIVKASGYQETVEGCVIFRRPLLPDTVELVGSHRDRLKESTVRPPEVIEA